MHHLQWEMGCQQSHKIVDLWPEIFKSQVTTEPGTCYIYMARYKSFNGSYFSSKENAKRQPRFLVNFLICFKIKSNQKTEINFTQWRAKFCFTNSYVQCQGRHNEFEPDKALYSTPNFWNPKSRQGPGCGGLELYNSF